jgi:hypothetical protein
LSNIFIASNKIILKIALKLEKRGGTRDGKSGNGNKATGHQDAKGEIP